MTKEIRLKWTKKRRDALNLAAPPSESPSKNFGPVRSRDSEMRRIVMPGLDPI